MSAPRPGGPPPDVFIVGAGPTGLALACELAWRRVRVRIVDAADGPVTTSNALGVMPRTLEQLEPHGIVDEMLRRGRTIPRIDVYAGGHAAASIDTTLDGSRFRELLVLPQRETERLLVERLRALGTRVEWRTRTHDITAVDDGVQAALNSDEGEDEQLQVPWLVACDGVGSTVRSALGVPFEGAAYTEAFNLADTRMIWPLERGVAHSFLSRAGLFFAVPLPDAADGGARFRLIVAESRGSAAERRPDPDLRALRGWLHERTPSSIAEHTTIGEPEWTSRFRIQRRVVPSLRHGRVLFAGDAAHVHSPAGAQGMNTGLQDAVNLGWKLAAVLRGEAPEALLDSYDAERLPVARAVIGATHGLTAGITARAATALIGRLIGTLTRRAAVRRRMLATTYGMLVQYRRSPIVADGARLAALRRVLRLDAPPLEGDRAPDVRSGPVRLYEALLHPGMTLLAFVDGDDDAAALAALRSALASVPAPLPRVVALAPVEGMQRSSGSLHAAADVVLADHGDAVRDRYDGSRHPLQLIRPDRHVAWRGSDFSPAAAAAALVRAYGG